MEQMEQTINLFIPLQFQKSLRFLNSGRHKYPQKRPEASFGTAGWATLWWKVSGPTFLHLNGANKKLSVDLAARMTDAMEASTLAATGWRW